MHKGGVDIIRNSFYETMIVGGKTTLKLSVAGFIGLLIYSFLVIDKVIYLPGAFIGISVVSVLLGGVKGGLSAPSVGWLHGMIVALVYSFTFTILRILLFPESGFNETALAQGLILLAVGSVGGVVGINAKYLLRRKKRYLGY